MEERARPQSAVGRRRLSADEVRDRVIETATQMLITDLGGLSVSLDHINMEALIAAAAVPRSTVYRIWPTKGDFISSFLQTISSADWIGSAAFDQETILLTLSTLRDNLDILDTVDGRREALRSLVRISVRYNYDGLVKSPEWATTVALTVTTITTLGGSDREALTRELRRTDGEFIQTMAELYRVVASLLGFRIRTPFTFVQLATCGASILEGLSLRSMIGLESGDEKITIPAGGEKLQEWTLAAAGFLAVFESMVEIDPDYQPLDAELVSRLKTANTRQLALELVGIEL